MGYSRDDAQRQQKEDLADAEWFTERMVALINELKLVKEPRRAAFVRGCLNAAMRQHGRLLKVETPPVDEYEDR